MPSGADVSALGNALLDAQDKTSVLAIAGSAAFGKKLGLGAAAANINLRRDVAADVLSGAELDAYAQGAALVSGSGPDTVTVNGVRISARATDDIRTAAAAGAGSQKIAIAASAAVTTMDSRVNAGIGASAEVNQDAAQAADSDQSVAVLADHQMFMLGIGGGISFGGKVAIGASTDVEVLGRQVGAVIGNAARVSARDDVVVQATDRLDVVSVTATGSVAYEGSGVAVDGSVGVLSYTNAVQASIDSNAVVIAGDDVRVAASAALDAIVIEAGVAAGAGSGIGGAVGVIVYDNTVRAQIGANAQVQAQGDLVLAADRSTDVLALSGSLAVGLSSAGIGLAAATVVNTETVEATVAAGAQLLALGQGTAAVVATGRGRPDGDRPGFPRCQRHRAGAPAHHCGVGGWCVWRQGGGGGLGRCDRQHRDHPRQRGGGCQHQCAGQRRRGPGRECICRQ